MPLTFILSILISLFQLTNKEPGGTGSPGGYSFSSRPLSIIPLQSFLREVSGIAFSEDGRLFAHNDERGTVYEIDRSSGRMLKQFAVGERRLREDLEDIAIVGDTFYLVSSKGDLFAFREGRDRENVPFMLYKTGLSAKNNVEGLCYDPGTDCLLLACKAYPGRDSGRSRTVYAFDLRTKSLFPAPLLRIDLNDLEKRYKLKEFQPSGIARHPSTGNYFVISAVGNSIIELSPGGNVLSYAGLSKKYHNQPEGIAFDQHGTLFIANEGQRKGTIVVFARAMK